MVFYRKYRPQNISELDLASVRTRLESILSQKEIPHAFLFTGSKGLGKTSTARILAKAINCQNKKGIEPCNECEVCTSITNGSNLDVLEIDAASNRGIDEIRELRERIKFAPAALSKKVYIIDEVHMLTADAFNALLKTLEEPPAHAIFILCTTELDKVPATITSRTFHITFQKPTVAEAINSLKRVAHGEKLDIDESVFKEIIMYSEDSFRDATKILEELSIASGGKKITKEVFDNTYKAGNVDVLCRELLDALSEKDAKRALSVIEKLSDSGANFKVITEKLVDMLHALILMRSGITKVGDDIKEFDDADLADLLSALNDSYAQIKTSILPNIPLELVVIHWCAGSAKEVRAKEAAKPAVEVREEEPRKTEKKEAERKSPAREEEKIEVATTTEAEAQSGEEDAIGMFSKNILPDTFFQSLIDKVKKDNHSIAGILRGCKLVDMSGDKVLFEAKYKFHRDKLNEARTIEILDKRASELLNRNIKVVVEMVAK